MNEPKIVQVGTAGEKSRGHSPEAKKRLEDVQLDLSKEMKSLDDFLNPPRKQRWT